MQECQAHSGRENLMPNLGSDSGLVATKLALCNPKATAKAGAATIVMFIVLVRWVGDLRLMPRYGVLYRANSHATSYCIHDSIDTKATALLSVYNLEYVRHVQSRSMHHSSQQNLKVSTL